MTDHVSMPEDGLHESKGISTADSDKVYMTDGAGSGTFEDYYGGMTKRVVVEALTDFPTASANVITLEDNTVYLLANAVDLGADKITMGDNTAIIGLDPAISSLTTTTAGSLFTATQSFRISGIKVTVASGTIFSCTGSAYESAWIENFTINSCQTVGTFTTWYSLYWSGGAVVSSINPLSFSGTCSILILDLVEWITGYTTGVDLGTATFNTCSFNRCGFGYASATNHIIIAASNANINSGKEGRFTLCNFNASATNIVANFAIGDVRWEARHNSNLENSSRIAQGYMHVSNTTSISGGTGDSGNPTLVDCGTDWVDLVSEQFTVSTGGRFTYVGGTPGKFLVSCNISGTVASGTQTCLHYIAKNDTVITGSRTSKEYASTAEGSPASPAAIVGMEWGDYVELYVENVTGTNDWESETLNMVITEVI